MGPKSKDETRLNKKISLSPSKRQAQAKHLINPMAPYQRNMRLLCQLFINLKLLVLSWMSFADAGFSIKRSHSSVSTVNCSTRTTRFSPVIALKSIEYAMMASRVAEFTPIVASAVPLQNVVVKFFRTLDRVFQSSFSVHMLWGINTHMRNVVGCSCNNQRYIGRYLFLLPSD